MYKAIVNNESFEITTSSEGHTLNGQPIKLDVVKLKENYFHVLYHGKSFRAEVVSSDAETKSFTIKINGRRYTVDVKDKFDLLLDKLGMNAGASAKVNHIKAPMPGLIIDLKVKEGDTVQKNDPLLILEAMKMENIIKSPVDGIVKSVKVIKGNSVEKGAVLIEF